GTGISTAPICHLPQRRHRTSSRLPRRARTGLFGGCNCLSRQFGRTSYSLPLRLIDPRHHSNLAFRSDWNSQVLCSLLESETFLGRRLASRRQFFFGLISLKS